MNKEKDRETSVERILLLGQEALRKSAGTDCIIGEKIYIGDITLVPISKVSAGYVSGGGEYEGSSKEGPNVSGGNGGGYCVAPIGFVSVHNITGDVKILPIDGKSGFEKLFELVPKIISAFNIDNKNNGKNEVKKRGKI